MNLSDYQAALRLRDFFEKLVSKIVQQDRPAYEYATVMSIDRINRKATVRFPTESVDIQVSMGSVQPHAVGQTVRINGLPGDRFIEDVMGPAYYAGAYSTGDYKYSARNVPDIGWLLCDGSFVSTSSYPDLFAVVGHTYNAGVDPGNGTFKVPDFRGRTAIGAGQGTGLSIRVLGAVGGAESHTLTSAQMPVHTHVQNAHSHPNPSADDGWYGIRSNASTIRATGTGGTGITFTANTGSQTATNQNAGGSGGVTQAHNIMSPFLVVNVFIKT